MKKHGLILVLMSLITMNAFAQAKKEPSKLLIHYYAIKDALVNSSATETSTKATDFLATLQTLNIKDLSQTNQKALTDLKEKLAFDAEHISESKDIEHQRDHFASLSLNIYALAKTIKLSDQPIYNVYCPMKKMYWLSSQESIKNPYYGKNMLTCGKITDTLK